jgi:hypothetical protein
MKKPARLAFRAILCALTLNIYQREAGDYIQISHKIIGENPALRIGNLAVPGP